MTTSVNIPQELVKAGRAKAKKTNRSFSNYVATLIAEDLQKDK